MSAALHEIDRCWTPLGELTLWRRRAPSVVQEFHEIRLGGEFLMSSLVNTSEIALAELALAELSGETWDILVGGLGLGYTAKRALDDPNVRTVTVVELLAPVIQWHRRGLVPLAKDLTGDPRCTFVHADFFRWIADDEDDEECGPLSRRFHAILLDIDHSPTRLLHPSHAAFYEADGLRRLARHLAPGGVFALWSAEMPDEAFTGALKTVFSAARTHEIEFFHPIVHERDANCIYVARLGSTPDRM